MPGERPQLRVVSDVRPAPSDADHLDIASLFREYCGYVATVAFRILGRRDEVDDVIQDVFIDAQRGIPGLRDPRVVKTWLATITVRRARRQIKKRRFLELMHLDRQDTYAEVADPSASPEQQALLSAVYRVLDRLPADERTAWVLRYVQGERLERVALLCDCSLATAKRRIRAALETIDKAFAHETA